MCGLIELRGLQGSTQTRGDRRRCTCVCAARRIPPSLHLTMQFNFAPVRSPLGSWPSLATGEALNQVGRQSGLRGEQERYSARHPNRAFERNLYLHTPLWRDSKNNNANQDVSPISKLFSILHSWILISSKRTCIALRNYTRIIHLISQEGDMQTGRTTE